MPVAHGQMQRCKLSVLCKLQQPLSEIAELALDRLPIGHPTKILIVGELGLHMSGMMRLFEIDPQGFPAVLFRPLYGQHGQFQQVCMDLFQRLAVFLYQTRGLHIQNGTERFEDFLVGQRHGAFSTVSGELFHMIAEELVDHDGQALGTSLRKEVIIFNTEFGAAQQLYPLLNGLQPVVELETHKETDVQVVTQTVVAR